MSCSDAASPKRTPKAPLSASALSPTHSRSSSLRPSAGSASTDKDACIDWLVVHCASGAVSPVPTAASVLTHSRPQSVCPSSTRHAAACAVLPRKACARAGSALCRYRTSKSNALETGVRPAARRVELNYAAAAALAAESHREQRPAIDAGLLEYAGRDAAGLEAAEAASAREWTRRLIESGCGTACDDDDDDVDAQEWGGGDDVEIMDEKVSWVWVAAVCGILEAAFCALRLLYLCRASRCLAKAAQTTCFCGCLCASTACVPLLPTPR